MLHSFDPKIFSVQPSINEIRKLYLEVIECLKYSELGVHTKETVLGIFETIDENEVLLFTTSRLIICRDGYQVVASKEEMEKLSIKKLWRDGILVKWVKLGDRPIGISNENYEMFDTISTLIQELDDNKFDIHDTQERNLQTFFANILAIRYSNGEIDEKEYHRLLTRIITVFPIESYYPKMKIQDSDKAIFVPHKLGSLLKMSFVNLLRYHCIQNNITIEEYETTMISLDLPFRSIYKVKPLISCEQCGEKNPLGSLFCISCQGSLID